jgi:DNA-binding transcriptional regulator YdaS (Cro superfamily)
MSARRASLLAVLVAAAAGTACGGGDAGPTKPVAGELMVRLTSPNATDGALVVRVVGPVTAVTPVGAYTISQATQGNITRVIVTGDIASGDLLRVKVPDVNQVLSYSANVEQAASRVDYALFSVSNYSLAIRIP